MPIGIRQSLGIGHGGFGAVELANRALGGSEDRILGSACSRSWIGLAVAGLGFVVR